MWEGGWGGKGRDLSHNREEGFSGCLAKRGPERTSYGATGFCVHTDHSATLATREALHGASAAELWEKFTVTWDLIFNGRGTFPAEEELDGQHRVLWRALLQQALEVGPGLSFSLQSHWGAPSSSTPHGHQQKNPGFEGPFQQRWSPLPLPQQQDVVANIHIKSVSPCSMRCPAPGSLPSDDPLLPTVGRSSRPRAPGTALATCPQRFLGCL